MRTILLPVAAAAIVVTSIGAFAASDTMTTGVIKSLDLKANILTLADGTAYTLPAGFKDPGLKVGEKVTIGWVMQNDKHHADTVVKAE